MGRFLAILILVLTLCSAKIPEKDCPLNFFIIISENQDLGQVIANRIFNDLAHLSTFFPGYEDITHPSYPNYIALTAGTTFGITNDTQVNISATNLFTLLEAKNISWKIYAEGYPGGCFLASQLNNSCNPDLGANFSCLPYYYRKHVPALSFTDVQQNSTVCDKVVNAIELYSDVLLDRVPQFALYIPNINNDGHNQNINYTAEAFIYNFLLLLNDKRFTHNRVLVYTFDESYLDLNVTQPIYTVFWGPEVQKGGIVTTTYNHYNLLRTIEDNFNLGTLGRNDSISDPMVGWRK